MTGRLKHCTWPTAVIPVLAVWLTACDFTVPLVTAPELAVDRALVGSWQRTRDDGQVERLLVLPMGTKEYLVAYPAGTPDSMYARVWRCGGAEADLLQVEWIGTAKGAVPEDGKVYQYATCRVEGASLHVQLLNNETLSGAIATADDLRNAMAGGRRTEDLFRPAMTFTNVPDR